MSVFGGVLDSLAAPDLRRIAPPKSAGQTGVLAAGAPSNQDILDATRRFYREKQHLIDTSGRNAHAVAQSDRSFVATMNGHAQAFKNNQLSAGARTDVEKSVFGEGSVKGIFDDTLDGLTADDLFTTVIVGVSAELIVFVGGMGGLGCAIDIAKREAPRGYGYATGELGLKVEADINVQVGAFNVLPSELDLNVFGLSVGAAALWGLSFAPFFKIVDGQLRVLGYSISAGLGIGGGAAIFGGHIWNFG